MFILVSTTEEMDGHAASTASLITLPFKASEFDSLFTHSILRDIIIVAIEEATQETIEELVEQHSFSKEIISSKNPRTENTPQLLTLYDTFIEQDPIIIPFTIHSMHAEISLKLVRTSHQFDKVRTDYNTFTIVSTYSGTS